MWLKTLITITQSTKHTLRPCEHTVYFATVKIKSLPILKLSGFYKCCSNFISSPREFKRCSSTKEKRTTGAKGGKVREPGQGRENTRQVPSAGKYETRENASRPRHDGVGFVPDWLIKQHVSSYSTKYAARDLATNSGAQQKQE